MKHTKALLISLALVAGLTAISIPLWAQQAATFWQVLVNTNLTIQPSTLTGPTPFLLESSTGATISQITSAGVFTSSGSITNGTAPPITGCGTPGSQTGGATAGSFTAGATSCTAAFAFGITAPHGWFCEARDITTPADLLTQSATSATGCTVGGTVVLADVIAFSAKAY